jgi:hypothetical protein
MCIQNSGEIAYEPWIGTVHIKPRPGNEIIGCAIGAFVPALALASSADEYVSKVTAKFDSYECDVLEVREIETCRMRFRGSPNTDIELLVGSLDKDHPVAFHDFHAY